MGKLFDVSLVFTSIPELLEKLPITLELAVLSMLLGLLLGLVMAIIKMKKIKVLTQITNLLISLLRGTPVIVQLYVAFFGIPMFLRQSTRNLERILQLLTFRELHMQWWHWDLIRLALWQKSSDPHFSQ